MDSTYKSLTSAKLVSDQAQSKWELEEKNMSLDNHKKAVGIIKDTLYQEQVTALKSKENSKREA